MKTPLQGEKKMFIWGGGKRISTAGRTLDLQMADPDSAPDTTYDHLNSTRSETLSTTGCGPNPSTLPFSPKWC